MLCPSTPLVGEPLPQPGWKVSANQDLLPVAGWEWLKGDRKDGWIPSQPLPPFSPSSSGCGPPNSVRGGTKHIKGRAKSMSGVHWEHQVHLCSTKNWIVTTSCDSNKTIVNQKAFLFDEQDQTKARQTQDQSSQIKPKTELDRKNHSQADYQLKRYLPIPLGLVLHLVGGSVNNSSTPFCLLVTPWGWMVFDYGWKKRPTNELNAKEQSALVGSLKYFRCLLLWGWIATLSTSHWRSIQRTNCK